MHAEVCVKREEPSSPAREESVVPVGLRTPEGSGGKGSRSTNIKGGKLVHRKGRLVSESSSEGGDDSAAQVGVVDPGGISSPSRGRSSLTVPLKEEQAPRVGSKGPENPLRSHQQPSKVLDKVSKVAQPAPLATGSKQSAGVVTSTTTKLRLVDIDFTGGRAKALASKQPPMRPAQRKPAPSVPVKKPDTSLPKQPTSSKISPRQQGGNVLMVSGVVDKASYGNHDDNSSSPTKPVASVSNGRKDLHALGGGASHAHHKDAILSAKFPQLKRKMLSEQLDAEAPAAKVKKLLS